jgi:hypothetical protein
MNPRSLRGPQARTLAACCFALVAALFPVLSEAAEPAPDVLPLPGSDYHLAPGFESSIKALPPVILAFPESLHLEATAQLAVNRSQYMVFGDTDHDGKDEAIFSRYITGNFYFQVFEAQGGVVYSDEYLGGYLIPYDTGDVDRDDRADIVGQRASQMLVYESLNPASYPSQLVWASGNLSNVEGGAAIGDTDLDGRPEIIYSVNTFGLYGSLLFFESDADNSYTQVYSIPTNAGAMGNKVIADLDYDGISEIAFATLHGTMYVVKSTGNDAWHIAWSAPTGLSNAYAVTVGPDLDGDGKPELFVTGTAPYPEGWKTMIFESSGVDQYALVASFSQWDGWGGGPSNAVANFTGSGRLEFVMTGYEAAWFYAATGPGQWELISELCQRTLKSRPL